MKNATWNPVGSEKLDEPLQWQKPRMIFVLFHEDAPDDFIDKVFAVMSLCHWHTFQVQTKRHERMAAYFSRLTDRVIAWDDGESQTEEFLITKLHDSDDVDEDLQSHCRNWLETWNARHLGWPLPHVWWNEMPAQE